MENSKLVLMCLDAATSSADAVDQWRRQRRTLERLPPHLADALLRHLLRRRLLFPSLLEVFKFSVEEIDLKGEKSVDAEWMAYLGAFQYLHSMNIADCHRINNSALWYITGMTYLKELDLSRCYKITDAGLAHLLSVPTLEKLSISETGVTGDGVKVLSSLTNLVLLDLGGLPITDSTLSSLQALSKLQHLDLWGSLVSNDGARVLETFPCLKFLSLAWTNVTRLSNLPHVSSLNMSNCVINSLFGEGRKARTRKLILSGAVIDNESEAFRYIETSSLHFLDLSHASLKSFSFLRSMNALNHLDLSHSSLDDESIENIAFVGENLTYLNLSNTKISSDGLGLLAGHVPNLESILLSGTALGDTAIAYISMMPSLKIINLGATNVKGMIRNEIPSFVSLQNLCHLERLELEEINLKDAALAPLAKVTELGYLSLRCFSLTDASLYRMSSVMKLTHLGIRDAVLTDAGLACFVPPPDLKVLDLRGCWLLTENVLLQFCLENPRIEVKHELSEAFDRANLRCSFSSSSSASPVRRKTLESKHRRSRLSQSPNKPDVTFLDQRLKYNREELLALQFSSASSSSSNSLI